MTAAGLFAFGVVAALLVAAWSTVWPDSSSNLTPTVAGAPPEGTTTWEGLDGRAVADNLFNHVVDAVAAGDSVQLQTFLPLALTAYADIEPLDPDALFHVATLQRIGDRPADAVESALRILSIDERHLLGLGTAAMAAAEAGESGEAVAYFGRFASAYSSEVERNLPEYVGHAAFLTRVETEARARLGGR